jgi:hypothetical protein
MIRPSLIPALFAMARKVPARATLSAPAIVEKFQSHDGCFAIRLAKPCIRFRVSQAIRCRRPTFAAADLENHGLSLLTDQSSGIAIPTALARMCQRLATRLVSTHGAQALAGKHAS